MTDAPTTDQTDAVIMYGHATCPMVPPVMGMLKRSAVPYEYVNIRKEPEAAARVREINAGNESVPTLVFPDGSTLTEPSARELRRKLRADGYTVDAIAMIWGTMLIWLPLLLFIALVILGAVT